MDHHERMLADHVESVRSEPAVLGVILVGSVARRTERPDSDVDVYDLVDDAAFDAALAGDRISWTEPGDDRPGGYVDVKLVSPAVLEAAAAAGDDPMRASFEGARIAFARIDGLRAVLDRIVRLPADAWQARVRAQLAQARLHGGYFLPQADARDDPFLRAHASTHLTLAAARAALAEHRVLLRGPKYVTSTLDRLDLPEGFMAAWHGAVTEPGARSAARLLAALDAWFGPDDDPDATLSTFIRDNELAWLHGRIPPEYS